MKKNLNDLYYSACVAYSDAVRTGIQSFREKSNKLFKEYQNLGGKRTAVHYISCV